jgi:hypothetical protein
MARPKHRRCQVCNAVTARYLRTQNAGAFVVKMWARDTVNGEVTRDNGTTVLCASCAGQLSVPASSHRL